MPADDATVQLGAGRCVDVPIDAVVMHEDKAARKVLATQQGRFIELGRREELLQTARTRMVQSNEQSPLAGLRAFLSSSGA